MERNLRVKDIIKLKEVNYRDLFNLTDRAIRLDGLNARKIRYDGEDYLFLFKANEKAIGKRVYKLRPDGNYYKLSESPGLLEFIEEEFNFNLYNIKRRDC